MTRQKRILTFAQSATTRIVVKVATRTGCFACRTFTNILNEMYYE